MHPTYVSGGKSVFVFDSLFFAPTQECVDSNFLRVLARTALSANTGTVWATALMPNRPTGSNVFGRTRTVHDRSHSSERWGGGFRTPALPLQHAHLDQLERYAEPHPHGADDVVRRGPIRQPQNEPPRVAVVHVRHLPARPAENARQAPGKLPRHVRQDDVAREKLKPPRLEGPRQRAGEGRDAPPSHLRLEQPLDRGKTLASVHLVLGEPRHVVRQLQEHLLHQLVHIRLWGWWWWWWPWWWWWG